MKLARDQNNEKLARDQNNEKLARGQNNEPTRLKFLNPHDYPNFSHSQDEETLFRVQGLGKMSLNPKFFHSQDEETVADAADGPHCALHDGNYSSSRFD